MSLTKKIKQLPKNPAHPLFIKVKSGGKQGWFECYIAPEKEGDEGKNIKVDFSTKGFFVLDNNLQTASGWNDDDKYSIRSNEVRILNEEGTAANGVLTVVGYPQDKKKEKFQIAKGTWKQIKDAVDKADGAYVKSIYAMIIWEGEFRLANIHLHGSSYASFLENIEDRKKNTEVEGVPRIHRQWIRVETWLDKSKGQTDYKVPVFEWGDKVSDEEYKKAEEYDTILQSYLDEYLSRGEVAPPADTDGEIEIPSGEEKEQPFDSKNWRMFREFDDQKYLGELSIAEILKLHKSEEERGKTEGNLYECLSHAKYEYEQLQKTGSWKEILDNSKTRKMGDYSKAEIEEKLALFKNGDKLEVRTHKMKLPLEVALETKEAEAGPPVDGKAEVVNDDEPCPF